MQFLALKMRDFVLIFNHCGSNARENGRVEWVLKETRELNFYCISGKLLFRLLFTTKNCSSEIAEEQDWPTKICILYSQTVFLGRTRGCDCIKRARHRSGVRSRWRPQSHCVVASRRWNFAARKNPHSRRKTQHPKCHSQGRRSLCVRSAKYRRHYICQCNSLCSR